MQHPDFQEMYHQEHSEVARLTRESGLMRIHMRDQFAMAALAWFMALEDGRTYNPDREDCKGLSLKEWRAKSFESDAEAIYQMADAMMKARNQSAE